ncbi:glycosyltransferase 87 family protein [Actinomyces sp. oral taxon 414]|uniref:glycosyltransferase 87 family protein n=1 Tax=Actinomyces sp. oral taxon 414 TaxID=712122 RepID=UPI0020A0BC67|nr:glycosyltransferase 87 family protein [Actinomyces sp. oral taxon 414]
MPALPFPLPRQALARWLARSGRLGARIVSSRLVMALGVLCLALPVVSWTMGGGVFAVMFDSSVYYGAIVHWRAGGDLYDWYARPLLHQYPFTYPPFAAWALAPLTRLGERGLQLVLTALTPVGAALTAGVCLRRLGAGRRLALGLAPWAALAASELLEPFRETLYEGQVNAVLMALVAVDVLAMPESSRLRGVASAVAASFKLTPAIALAVFLIRREWRAAATMTATAVGITAACWLADPAQSRRFFASAMLDPSRTGFAEYAGNQNLRGTIARLLPEPWWTPVWAVCAALVLAGGWLVCRRLERVRAAGGPARCDHGVILALELGVVMVTGLLISPVSWSHHWVWALEVLLALGAAARAWRSSALAAVTAAGAVVIGVGIHWSFPFQSHAEFAWPLWQKLVGSGYTWWALLAGAVLARAARRRERPVASAVEDAQGSQPREAVLRDARPR